MADIDIRSVGRAGRITLTRPNALNALTGEMSIAIETALAAWEDDAAVDLVIIDAAGERAFCAGGDIADLYKEGRAGNFEYGRDFWRQEYRLNLMIATYAKPIMTFLQGFTMGGGVGIGCHASHRFVGETSKIAMPECGIGLIPDVGGSRLLGKAPDGLGLYLGLTGARMAAGDAIHAGFADHLVPLDRWDDLKTELINTGGTGCLDDYVQDSGPSTLAQQFSVIRTCFEEESLTEIAEALEQNATEGSERALKGLAKGSPLAMACALRAIRQGATLTLAEALAVEYRFAHRAQDQSDFLEGIRAQIIDRDFSPKWKHSGFDVSDQDVNMMLAPLGENEWTAGSRL